MQKRRQAMKRPSLLAAESELGPVKVIGPCARAPKFRRLIFRRKIKVFQWVSATRTQETVDSRHFRSETFFSRDESSAAVAETRRFS
jgi:hypothetical protein